MTIAQITGAPDGVGGTAGNGEDRVTPGVVHGHQRTVVLREIDLGIGDAQVRQRAGKPLGKGLGHLVECGVEDGGVLPLDQSHGADLAGDGHVDVRPHDLPAQLRRQALVVITDRGEHAGDGDRAHAFGLQARKEGPGCPLVKGGEFLPVVFKPAADDGGIHSNGPEILRPVHHGRDPHCGGSADAQHADGRQMLALHNGVGALGRPQHGLPDFLPVHAGLLQHRADRIQDAFIGVGGGMALHTGHHIEVFVNQDGVCVGAAHINSQLIHQPRPPLHRSSSGI